MFVQAALVLVPHPRFKITSDVAARSYMAGVNVDLRDTPARWAGSRTTALIDPDVFSCMSRRRVMRAVSFIVVLGATSAQASPNLSLDEPVYEELAHVRLQGRLPAYLGVFQPLTEWRARRLFREADVAVPDEPTGGG